MSELHRLIEAARDIDAEDDITGYALMTFHRDGSFSFAAYADKNDEEGRAVIADLHESMMGGEWLQ